MYYRVDNRARTSDRPFSVPDFNQMYELYDRITVMFFFRNKHMMCDFGTGNNNKMNFLLENSEEIVDIVEEIYRGAKKGRGLVVSPKGEFFLFALKRRARTGVRWTAEQGRLKAGH